MLYTIRFIDVTEKWRHDPLIRDKDGNTVAMIFARRGKDIPIEWRHNIDVKNKSGWSL